MRPDRSEVGGSCRNRTWQPPRTNVGGRSSRHGWGSPTRKVGHQNLHATSRTPQSIACSVGRGISDQQGQRSLWAIGRRSTRAIGRCSTGLIWLASNTPSTYASREAGLRGVGLAWTLCVACPGARAAARRAFRAVALAYELWLWVTVMFELLFRTFAAFPTLILLFEIE